MSAEQFLPGDVITSRLSKFTGNPADLGVQIRDRVTDLVKSARSAVGIANRPAGSDSFIVERVVPVEQGKFSLIWDDNLGIIIPARSVTIDFDVVFTIQVDPSGLGPIADAAKRHMAQTFDRLKVDTHYGTNFIAGSVEVVKARVMTAPPVTSGESSLHPLVIDYLGKLVALELMPAAVDYWAVQYQSESTGQDPTEAVSYPDRLKALEALETLLLKQVRKDEASVLPLLVGNQRLRTANDGPLIDEPDGVRVTQDPRDFPPFRTFASDLPARTGVKL